MDREDKGEERIDAEARAKRMEQEAKERAERQAAIAEEHARRQAIEAVEAEKARVAAQQAAEAAEQARRERDKKHKAAVNRAALAALVDGGLTEETAKLVVTLIASGKVPAVSINY